MQLIRLHGIIPDRLISVKINQPKNISENHLGISTPHGLFNAKIWLISKCLMKIITINVWFGLFV